MTTSVQIKTLNNERMEVQAKSDCTISELKSQLFKEFGYGRQNQIFFNNSQKLVDETNISTLDKPISLILYITPNSQTSIPQKQIQKQEKENTETKQVQIQEKENTELIKRSEKEKTILKKGFEPYHKLESFRIPVSQNCVSLFSAKILAPVIHYAEQPKVVLNYNEMLLRELLAMGFDKERCRWALHETRNDLQSSIEWLFNQNNTVRSRINSLNSKDNNNSEKQSENETKIQNIVNLGFPREQVIQMLEICNGNQEQAINLLLGSNF
ncbi:hypothetical protein M0812_06656 [Anaeramoeba flamelloides]|uniref:UBA domain-containing protein n=1 Tax=Anaeramoeba flamelloides TaxID=1746091 RepID=A0AAV8AC19_9EUKA|nr:hypothetical protein M0812_06656 [Anaeramoeba flamelloides]